MFGTFHNIFGYINIFKVVEIIEKKKKTFSKQFDSQMSGWHDCKHD